MFSIVENTAMLTIQKRSMLTSYFPFIENQYLRDFIGDKNVIFLNLLMSIVFPTMLQTLTNKA